MKAQIPAKGIYQKSDFGDSKSYGVACGCGDSAHEHQLWIEADEEFVTVNISTKVKSKWWQLNRWQKIWTLLTRGYVEYQADLLLKEQQALNYAETLKKAITDVKQFRQQEHINKP